MFDFNFPLFLCRIRKSHHDTLNLLLLFPELQGAVEEVLPSLSDQQVKVFTLADKCKNAEMESFKDKMRQASCEPLSKDLRSQLTLASVAVYIYTSGTTGETLKVCLSVRSKRKMASGMMLTCGFSSTGLPKAAEISHGKLWMMSVLLTVAGVKSSDVVYTSLPLYHSAGFLGFTSAIELGTLTLGLQTGRKAARAVVILIKKLETQTMLVSGALLLFSQALDTRVLSVIRISSTFLFSLSGFCLEKKNIDHLFCCM